MSVAPSSGPMLAHTVYFTLRDRSEGARQRLIAQCKEHLSGHPGTIHFSVGVLCPDLNRPVNVRDFDVALHLTFASKEAHDQYQAHPRHVKFVEENKAGWAQVRVFDDLIAE